MKKSFDHNYCASFQEAMIAEGIGPPALPIDDGAIHRFRVEGDKADTTNGWYILHGGQIPAGAFGCWKRAVSTTWCAIAQNKMDPKLRKQHEHRMEHTKALRAKEKYLRQKKAAINCGCIWTKASPYIDIKHSYLMAKQIKPIGLKQFKNSLLIPIQNSLGELINLQSITPDGTKRFMYGGAVKSCYTVIGELQTAAFVCEGYATGVTIHQATNRCVIVAFNAGNLLPVIKSITTTSPDIELVIAADNDHCSVSNVGLDKGKFAAKTFGLPLVYPLFQKGLDGSDFNDLAAVVGIKEVSDQLAHCFKEVS
ncbi:MAG: toprim domain-containing protein [Oceanospirillaceae bacterium]|nr:toprim domain-containing protein [Oceanospirillaceae bacterium]